jgi:hypothetical protein
LFPRGTGKGLGDPGTFFFCNVRATGRSQIEDLRWIPGSLLAAKIVRHKTAYVLGKGNTQFARSQASPALHLGIGVI